MGEKRNPGRGKGKCKGPEAGSACLEGGREESQGDQGPHRAGGEEMCHSVRRGYNSRVGGRVEVRPSDLFFIKKTLWGMDLGVRVEQGEQQGGDCRVGDGEDQARVPKWGREKGRVWVVWGAGRRPARVSGPRSHDCCHCW